MRTSTSLWIGILAGISCSLASPIQAQSTTGDVVVRVDDTSGSHCIDADTEKITVFVRRVFVQRKGGLFTQDNRAGVLVRSQLAADSKDPNQGQSTVQVPSVDMVSVKDDRNGRVSLALEYAVASDLMLSQGSNVTKTMDLYINLAKTRGTNTFGEVLDVAGQALQQVSLPTNPFLQAGSKFLKFANDAVNSSIKAANDDQIAHIASTFRQGKEDNLARCKSAGNERTGVIAAVRSTGAANSALIPMTNTDRDYCFRYSSESTFELLAAKRNTDGSCPAAAAFNGVMNDYVMLLISAEAVSRPGKSVAPDVVSQSKRESASRCANFRLPATACGAQ